jgi:uncharacterized protein (TIGR03067 family)
MHKTRGGWLTVVAACVAVVVMGGAGLARAPAPFERTARTSHNAQNIVGTWRLIEAHANGKHHGYETSPGQVWEITPDLITVTYRDVEVNVETFVYTTDPTETPRPINLSYAERDEANGTFRGIYEVKGNRLRLNRSRGSRPTSLDGDEFRRGQILYVLERVKR